MKYILIITFLAAAVHFFVGFSIWRGRFKSFVNVLCKESGRYKILGGYVILLGAINLLCFAVMFLQPPYAIVCLAVAALLVSIIQTLIRRENL